MADTRRTVRWVAAALSAATAALYFIIGTEGVRVVDETDEPDIVFIIAGLLYLAGTVLLMLYDHRVLWVLGSTLQVFIIWAYFNIAVEREPSYEAWGITIRVVQIALLALLVVLAARQPATDSRRLIRARG